MYLYTERKRMSDYNEAPEYIPISYLNAYAYCPRRFYYEFTLGEMLVNATRRLSQMIL